MKYSAVSRGHEIRAAVWPAAAVLLMLAASAGLGQDANRPPPQLAPYFAVPGEFDRGDPRYQSAWMFEDGRRVMTAEDWPLRRAGILKYWHNALGPWPPLIDKPRLELGAREERDGVTQFAIQIETAPGRIVKDAYLLIPAGQGPFPAVVVVYYEANTAIGRGKSELRDFALQLARRGFVALSLGGDPNTYYPTREKCRIQPLSFHAYEAANCYNALANRRDVDPRRIGVVGHSYGGKWALFAACLYDKFACGAVSDPGIVFDETRGNVNYWEPWYLGFDPELSQQRKPGIPSIANPRTGPYKQLLSSGHDLNELHALMAPRPLLVSGGAEDQRERWLALRPAVALNGLLGQPYGIAMTNRPKHSPTAESNELLYEFFEWALKPPR